MSPTIRTCAKCACFDYREKISIVDFLHVPEQMTKTENRNSQRFMNKEKRFGLNL